MQKPPRHHPFSVPRLLPRATLAAAIGLLAASPAGAQYYGYNTPGPLEGFGGPGPVFRGYDRPLPPDEIVERLEDRGFEDVSRPRFDGANYSVEAVSPRGVRVRLVIDAFQGRVVDRVAIGRGAIDDEDDPPRFGARPGSPREWFGNNAPPPAVPYPDNGSRSARIDPPAPVEAAPLGEPSPRQGGPALPAPRDTTLAPRTQPDKAAGLPKPGSGAAPIEGGNPDLLRGEQRKPTASTAGAPSTAGKPKPSTEPPSRPVASVPAEPAPSAEPVSVSPKVEASKPDAAKADAPKVEAKTEALSPIRPLRPQVAPDVSTLNAEAARSSEKPVRVIGGVTPVPAPATGSVKGGPVTADSNDVKP